MLPTTSLQALDVANIVPWKWDLLSKTILCDINKPIELSTNEKDISEEQLAVPDSQYFSKIFKEDRKRVEKAYEDLLKGRSDKVREEYRVVNIQNHIHRIEWVEAQAAVETRDKNGKPLSLVGSSLIITKTKKDGNGIDDSQRPGRRIQSSQISFPRKHES